MRAEIAASAAALLSIIVFATAASAENWLPISSKQDYIARVSERVLTQLEGARDTYISHSDGSVTGVVQGSAYFGDWVWNDGAVCFDGGVEGGQRISACALVETTETLAKFSWVGWKTFTYKIGEK